MNQDKYIFTQLTAFLSRTQFNYFVRKHDGNQREAIQLLESVTCYDIRTTEQSNQCYEHHLLSLGYCLHNLQLKRSTYEVLQIPNISLTDKTNLRDIFYKTDFNDVKELDCLIIEVLFD